MSEKDQTVETEGFPTLTAKGRKNYGGKYEAKGNVVPCYTARQMKSLYPGKEYEKLFEYVPDAGGRRLGFLGIGKKRFPLFGYGSHNRLIYRETGYLAVNDAEDSFVVLLKNALPQRIAALVLCIGLAVGSIVFLTSGRLGLGEANTGMDAISTPISPELEGSAVDWEGNRTQDTGGVVPGIAIPGYKSITIDADKTDVQVNFQNPEGNPCYFEISLILGDGTVLYQSKMIEPGKGLYEITLSEALAPGEYDAVVKYNTYSLSDLNPMNGAEVKIKLIAL